MKSTSYKMQQVWNRVQSEITCANPGTTINLDEIVSPIFAIGPAYYYLLNLQELSISNISSDFESIHGIAREQARHIHQIFELIHPEDVEFVTKAEERAHFHLLEKGADKITRYKVSYNLRFRVADGTYHLFNHQSLILSLDEHSNALKSINIHTDISHITCKNNYKWSAIGLTGEPSYLNLDVEETNSLCNPAHKFSRRELEIMRLITEGHDSNKIADTLFIAPDTVKTHRKNIMAKSGCANVAELAARSISEGWI